ncbi:hypothetical protein K490DRAFT_17411, partial [Saccharata proteae CBS 121410]
MPFFSKVFKSKDPKANRKLQDDSNGAASAPAPPRWEESWSRKEVAPEEVGELIHVCTQEMKSRALDMPFLLLPFRPGSDASAARGFIRNFFKDSYEGGVAYKGEGLQTEMRLTEPIVLCSIMKWCWSRLPGGVVTWDAYELFKIGEQDSDMAPHSFDTFIPLSVESDARKQIIFDFFDLLSAVAARGKTNGLGGRKLSRMAGWWAFAHFDTGKGFDGGYTSWSNAANATSHLFFAYLRSLSPESVGAKGITGISNLPRSLQALVAQTEYPPESPALMHTTTTKVVMIVDSVSPTPFALLRRAKNFEYRDDDEALQHFSNYDDPILALTDECRRVLNEISKANQSTAAEGIAEGSWSRFEDMGFGFLDGLGDGSLDTSSTPTSPLGSPTGLRRTPRTRNGDFGRPTTPSWADFLSTGFTDDQGNVAPSPVLLPPEKALPPIGHVSRVQSSQSHMKPEEGDGMEPGELASITQFDLDETFWWVWMTSLAGEEPNERKAVFGRCALIETTMAGRWLVMEEQVKGASPGPEEGAYIAEKKSKFSFTRRGRLGRRKSTGKKLAPKEPYDRNKTETPMSSTSVGPDQHARIQAAAAKLAQRQRDEKEAEAAQRRGRMEDAMSTKTNSVLTLQPMVANEAGPAMKWARNFDKQAIRAQYLGDSLAGKGVSRENLLAPITSTGNPSATDLTSNGGVSPGPASPGPAASPYDVSPGPPSPAVPEKDIPSSPASPREDKGPHVLRKEIPRKAPPAPLPTTTTPSSPEAKKKHDPKKLKKQAGGGGGFMKMFGKKKPAPGVKGPEIPDSAPPPYQQNDAGRNDSTVHKKSIPIMTPESRTPDTDSVDAAAEPQLQEPEQAEHGATEDRPSISRVHSHEQREADEHFSRFDQGPLDDVPAFVPEDSDHEEELPSTAKPEFNTRAGAALHQTITRDHEARVGAEQQVDDDTQSEASLDLATQTAPPTQDRWAQIRQNAAARAARRSEEQQWSGRPSESHTATTRTDDGDTSGEETIESRVARIKARVAELTGNME